MKKWQMEGIINRQMNTRSRLVFASGNRMYLARQAYYPGWVAAFWAGARARLTGFLNGSQFRRKGLL